jgi:hypothetical protein
MKQFYLQSLLLLALSANAQIGIGTTTPNASAALDITSTTQGLLPPRMTTEQRNLINTPGVGLVIFNTNISGLQVFTGSVWQALQVEKTYVIGLNSDLGGYVFFVTPDGKHGLVAATKNQSNNVFQTAWVNAQDNISNPIYHNSDGKKFTDWRLPTKYELNLMHIARVAIGAMGTLTYWSSTEFDNDNVWVHIFGGIGFQETREKVDLMDGGQAGYDVRAVRSF